MVKFGRELFYSRVPEWSESYCDYDAIVARLEKLSEVVFLHLRARCPNFPEHVILAELEEYQSLVNLVSVEIVKVRGASAGLTSASRV